MATASPMLLVLASASPRRRELLEREGLVFEVCVSPAEEIHNTSMQPAALCELNAVLKAVAVASGRSDATVIAADTLVFIDGEVLGKPADLSAAHGMLRRLAGRTHQVCTGVCVIFPNGTRKVFHDISEVTFRPLDEAAIRDYFTRVDPLDKAGAYGIQEHGERIIARICGSFDNVMGLPVAQVLEVLREESDCEAGGDG
jgi:septum formation protein